TRTASASRSQRWSAKGRPPARSSHRVGSRRSARSTIATGQSIIWSSGPRSGRAPGRQTRGRAALATLDPHPHPLPEGEGMEGVPLPEGEGMEGVPLPEREGAEGGPLPEREGAEGVPLPGGEGAEG